MTLKELSMVTGKPLHYEKYRMWHHVPFVGDTAIVVDESVPGGGQRIIMGNMIFPKEVTDTYIVNAVNNNAISLGDYRVTDKKSKFIPWNKRTWFPLGYFTHMIGADIISA